MLLMRMAPVPEGERTPLDEAQSRDHQEVVELLRAAVPAPEGEDPEAAAAEAEAANGAADAGAEELLGAGGGGA